MASRENSETRLSARVRKGEGGREGEDEDKVNRHVRWTTWSDKEVDSSGSAVAYRGWRRSTEVGVDGGNGGAGATEMVTEIDV